VYKFNIFIIFLILLTQCSLDTKTGFWTKKQIIKEEKKSEVLFEPEKILEKEFNNNLKIRIESVYKKKPFINNLTNNAGYINFESNFEEISKFKFKKIKNFDFINPELFIGKDKALVFFDEKGSILKFDKNSKLIWKKNHYDKKQIKQKPSLYFAANDKILIIADSIANLYAVNYSNGDLLWKTYNKSSFNSEIKIYQDKIFLIDFENVIKCISITTGEDIWSFGTQRSFIKSQRKLSLVIQDQMVMYTDTFGDINALDINNGSLIWQSQTINEDIFETAFLLKYSKLVYDNDTIYISNNQNKFFAIDSRNGIIKWEQTINSFLEPTIIKNLIFTVSNEGYLIILDKNNGNILRSTNILDTNKKKNIFPTGFVVAKDFIYLSLSNGKLHKISVEDGKTKKIIKIDGHKISRPYIVDRQMYLLKDNAVIKIE